MIGFDGSTLAFEENVRQTKQAVEAIKSIKPDIVVEGELGYIGSGSEIHDTVPELIFTKPDEAREFAEAAGGGEEGTHERLKAHRRELVDRLVTATSGGLKGGRG
jgi:hypothetical protein